MEELTIILFILAIFVIFFLMKGNCGSNSKTNTNSIKEHYRDPLFMNRAKYALDYYSRSNGSIYGDTLATGGSWSIFSGFPQYFKAY